MGRLSIINVCKLPLPCSLRRKRIKEITRRLLLGGKHTGKESGFTNKRLKNMKTV